MDHTYLPTIITITLLQRSFDVEMKIYEFKDKVEKVVSSLKGGQERDKKRWKGDADEEGEGEQEWWLP